MLQIQSMRFKKEIVARSGIDPTHVPSSYQLLGDIILLKLFAATSEEKKTIALLLKQRFPKIKTICEIVDIEGELRQPQVKPIIGAETETLHREHAITYQIDVAKTMFSKGNHSERKRLMQYDMNKEVIVDMFAGIGYFSLPLAKYSKAKKIIALEKNPEAFSYLQKNITLNKIKNIEPVHGDCRDLASKFAHTADRIIMGYFPHTEQYLSAAVYMLKSHGMIHFHNVYTERELESKLYEEHIRNVTENEHAQFSIREVKKVKSIAPRTYHVVIDVEVKK